MGGGFETFKAPTFRQYAPEPFRVHDAHSIYFEVMGEHGFIGLGLFLLMGIFTWFRAQQVIRACKKDAERKWASDLASMVQVSLVGYAVGGTFLGLAYFDLPYHLMIIVVLTARFSGVLNNDSPRAAKAPAPPPIHPSARWSSRR
jgi:probable O-glycosylation ligase (exosortase A-associated)